MAAENNFYGVDEAKADIAAHEVLVAVFSAPLVANNGKVLASFKRHGWSSADEGTVREILTKMFPDAPGDAITRGVMCFQHRVSNHLAKVKA